MPHPLDFIVFGVPRSGTSALARALNLHPNVLCAMERFYYSVDHASLSFPNSFLTTTDVDDSHDYKKIDYVRTQLAEKPQVLHAGNKLPRYYFGLERINREVPALRNIWIYRSPFGFVQSWNRRELNHRKGRWRAGQVGVFGFLELLVCIDNCTRLGKDIFLFPYEFGLNQSAEPVMKALDFLGADAGSFDRNTFEAELLPRRRDGAHRLPLRDNEEEMFAVLKVRELDAIMERGWGLVARDVAADLRDYLRSMKAGLPAAVDRALRGYDNPAVPYYGAEFFARHRPALGTLLELTQGSTVIANMQRAGPLKRLKSLYVQRSALMRRLAGFRLRGRAALRAVRGRHEG